MSLETRRFPLRTDMINRHCSSLTLQDVGTDGGEEASESAVNISDGGKQKLFRDNWGGDDYLKVKH